MRLRRAAAPRVPRALWLHGLWPDHNPLRRTSDRIEAAIVASALIVFLIGAPLAALAAGHWAGAAALRLQRDQHASWHQVSAVLLANASPTVNIGYGAGDTSEVHARWTAPDGTVRTGNVPAPVGAPKGSTVRIWVDQSGAVTGPPLRPEQATGQAVLATVVAPFVLGTVLICAVSLSLQVLDWRRLADWDADWQATGPRWNSHR
jgi:hypothetical protein